MNAELEAEPDAAATIFGGQLALARSFTQNLARHGEELGLIGPLELPRLWTRHVLNSAVVAPLLDGGARVADIGSGAGLPGLVLAIARPDVELVLVEPMERRVDWLSSQVDALSLGNVTVRRARAEDLGETRAFDQVTARAVSALRTLLPMTVPLLRDGGELILMKGASVEREIDAAEKVIRRLRLEDVRVEEVGGTVTEVTRVFRARRPQA